MHDENINSCYKDGPEGLLAHVISKFKINKIEPWSEHFRSREPKYLEELRSAVEKAAGVLVNIAVDGQHSPYAVDKAEREKAIAFSKQWIDVAVSIGSPSVRTNMPPAKDSKPDLDRAAGILLRVAEYGASKNIHVNLENDNPLSEDPFFIVSVIEKVGSPWLHANPDFANTLAARKADYAFRGIAAMFKHAYSICHVKAMEADEKGQLVRGFEDVWHSQSSNYKGFCSMEFDSPGDHIKEPPIWSQQPFNIFPPPSPPAAPQALCPLKTLSPAAGGEGSYTGARPKAVWWVGRFAVSLQG